MPLLNNVVLVAVCAFALSLMTVGVTMYVMMFKGKNKDADHHE